PAERQRQLEPEGAALARLAHHADPAVHGADQSLADRQPQAAAAIMAGGRAVRLGERLEQGRLARGRDADPAVFDGEMQPVLVVEPALLDSDPDMAARGE